MYWVLASVLPTDIDWLPKRDSNLVHFTDLHKSGLPLRYNLTRQNFASDTPCLGPSIGCLVDFTFGWSPLLRLFGSVCCLFWLVPKFIVREGFHPTRVVRRWVSGRPEFQNGPDLVTSEMERHEWNIGTGRESTSVCLEGRPGVVLSGPE